MVGCILAANFPTDDALDVGIRDERRDVVQVEHFLHYPIPCEKIEEAHGMDFGLQTLLFG